MSPLAGGGWNFSTLYAFKGGKDAANPINALVFDSTGNLYGTGPVGGANNEGAVFELTPVTGGGWSESVIYSFGAHPEDGALPAAGLTVDQSRNLYGTTVNGGSYGYGTVFELVPYSGVWTESVLYNFQGQNSLIFDGGNPYAPLTLDSAGNLYGTTYNGGFPGNGTVFELTATGNEWSEKILYQFDGSPDGARPMAGVTFDPFGNLYGTTYSGGGLEQSGTVFELSPSGGGDWIETVLHRFGPTQNDGGQPVAAPILDAQGNLYGTTGSGSPELGPGTAYRLSLNGSGHWVESRYNFSGGIGGEYPLGGLIFNGTGELLGTTAYGGDGAGSGYGLIFQIKP
jgi:uncharacterized repeat protein (TIGR03803 family)